MVRGHEREIEGRFGVAAAEWSSSGHDGVLEAYTQSHPRVPKGCKTKVRWVLVGESWVAGSGLAAWFRHGLI